METKIMKIPVIIMGFLIFTLTFLTAQKIITENWLVITIMPLLIIPLLSLIQQKTTTIHNVALTFFGLIYIILPLSISNYLVFNDIAEPYYVPDLLLYTFLLIWTNDTFAFITGKLTGKHKLAQNISPGKTWEGIIGGILFSILVSILIATFSNTYPLIHWINLAVIISISANLGDLTESILKRTANVKDSGHILPGHGGILDRFDAAFLAIPVVFVYLKCFLA